MFYAYVLMFLGTSETERADASTATAEAVEIETAQPQEAGCRVMAVQLRIKRFHYAKNPFTNDTHEIYATSLISETPRLSSISYHVPEIDHQQTTAIYF